MGRKAPLDDAVNNPCKIFPLILKKTCCKCQKSFVRELGWQVYPPCIRDYSVCGDCAPTREIAVDIFTDKLLPPERRFRPEPPPAPPPIKS